jgi:glycosyltransferase involved in cell wall biosynthesis
MEKKSLSTLTHGLTSVLHAARRKPDVALIMNVANGFWLPILRARGIPVVVNVDGIEWERAKWGRIAKWAFRTGATLTARFAQALVFDSEEIGNYWRRRFGRNGVFIPYGGSPPPGDLPVEPGLRHRAYVLVVARFVPENSVPEFLEAASGLPDDVDVVIVGSTGVDDELGRAAIALADRKPRVRLLGHISDDSRLNSLWQHAGVYFHGHSVGGTNPALVQAMACGAPIVARNTVFNREVLGDQGAFVEPEPRAIREALLATLADAKLQVRMSRGASSRAAEHYSWLSVCEDYETTLSTVTRAP